MTSRSSHRRFTLLRWIQVCALALSFVGGASLLEAQAPAPAPAAPAASVTAQPASANRLPVRRVILYKNGVGYFEHVGRVRGNQTVTVDFTSGQLNDVLKSLTALDLDGGRVAGVSYNSEAGLDRRLGALRLPVGQQTTRGEFLTALRGARLDVRSGATRVLGRLLSVEKTTRATGGATAEVEIITLVTDAGDVQTVALDPGVSVRIVEAELNQEVGRYLALVSSVRDQDLRRLAIATTGTGERDLFVSYVSEVPVWKATYRLVLSGATTGPAARPLLQGWAIVDNTVGEDWENVELSLVAGAPQSFIQQISQPYYVQRPVVPLPARILLSPQTHLSPIGTPGAGAVAGRVTDMNAGAIPGVTVRATRTETGDAASAVTDGNGRYRLAGLTPGVYSLTFDLPGFRTSTASGVGISGGMETTLDTRLEVGGVTEAISVSGERSLMMDGVSGVGGRGRGGFGGRGGVAGGVPAPPAAPVMRQNRIDEAMTAFQTSAAAAELGDLFEYRLANPITIRKNQSALVPILSGEVAVDKVSLWTPSSGPRPLRALWLTNSTKLTLDGGTFSVVEGSAFAGEGLMDPLKAGERRLLSYAADLAMTVNARTESSPTRVTKVSVARGVITQVTEDRQQYVYTARNEDAEPRVLVVEHPIRTGWATSGTVLPAESTATVQRYRIPVAARTTATFTIDETRPGQATISVTSLTDNTLGIFVRDKMISPALEAALREIQAKKVELARISGDLAARQREIDQIGRDQERVRGNLQALKGSAEERQLVQRYVRQLDEQETRLDVLRRELQTLTADQARAQTELNDLIARAAG